MSAEDRYYCSTVEPHYNFFHGTGKSYLNAEVTILQGVHCTVEYDLGLSKGDRNGGVTLLVR